MKFFILPTALVTALAGGASLAPSLTMYSANAGVDDLLAQEECACLQGHLAAGGAGIASGVLSGNVAVGTIVTFGMEALHETYHEYDNLVEQPNEVIELEGTTIYAD